MGTHGTQTDNHTVTGVKVAVNANVQASAERRLS